MSALLEKLRDIGCDIDGAMPRFLNNEDFYIKCLKKFVADDVFEHLQETLKSNQVEDSFKHAHNLKGVCANMGITPIQDIIFDMVEVLRGGEIPVDGLEKINSIIEIRDKIKEYLNE